MTMRPSDRRLPMASLTARWLPSMSSSTRVAIGLRRRSRRRARTGCARPSGTAGRARRSARPWACPRGPRSSRAAALLARARARRRCAARARSAGSPRSGRRRKKSPTSASSAGSGDQHGVVDVPGLLPPRIEDDLLPGVVGMQRRDDAPERVVEQDRADAVAARSNSKRVRGAEERLVLPDRLALVVEDRPAAADPARARRRAAVDRPARARPGPSSGSRGRSRRSTRSCAGPGSARRRRDRTACVSRASV